MARKILTLFALFAALACSLPTSAQTPFAQLPLRSGLSNGSSHTADTLAWKADVIANGGAAPSEATLTAVDTWVTSVASIKSQFIWVSFIAPDSLIAAKTPIYHTTGSDPATSGGSLSGLNGITAPGGGAYLTGVNTSVAWTTSDIGLATLVASQAAGEVPRMTYGGGDGGTCVMFWGHANSYCISDTSPWISCPAASYTANSFGWMALERTAANAWAVYAAQRTGYAWTTIASGAGASGALPNSGTGANSIGWFSGGVCATESTGTIVSYMSVTHGMSSGNAQIEFNAAAALRLAFGGGS